MRNLPLVPATSPESRSIVASLPIATRFMRALNSATARCSRAAMICLSLSRLDQAGLADVPEIDPTFLHVLADVLDGDDGPMVVLLHVKHADLLAAGSR